MRFTLTLIGALYFTLTFGQLNKVEQRLIQYIDDTNPAAEQFLKELVNINSGTLNFDGVREVGDRLLEKFGELGMTVSWVDGSEFHRAGHLVAKVEGGKGNRILLIGHLDTVFELDSPNQEWEQIDDNTVKGPGIADMKGGDVIILQALSALHSQGLLQKMNVHVVMTGDEEFSGRPLAASKKALIESAEWANIALGFENADGDPKTVNVARRSSSGWELTVTGTAAHSSQIFKPDVGAGAIYEASRILNQFYEELSGEQYLTFNPGYIVGGTQITHGKDGNSGTAFGKRNVVAKEVVIKGDIRCISMDQLQKAQDTMRRIVAENRPKTAAEISFSKGYPPFEPIEGNYDLMRKFSQVSQDLGFGEVTAVDPRDAGAADISFTAGYVEMGIDGLGLAGKYDHTIREIGYLDALPMQSKRAAVLLYRLAFQN